MYVIKPSVLCLGFHFSITNRRILSQLHDVLLKYLIKIRAIVYVILWHSTAYWSQNYMASEEECLLKTLL